MGHARLADNDHSKEWPKYLKDQEQANRRREAPESGEPIVVKMDADGAEGRLQQLISQYGPGKIIDNYDEQFAELQLSLNAQLYRANEDVQRNSIKDLLKKHYGGKKSWQLGSWVYFPWRDELVHVLAEDDFINLRTIRNRDLITKEEQAVLYDFPVLCVGMSVGSASAIALVQGGVSRQIKVADGAVISGSNLNRLLTGVSSVGVEKAVVTARFLYEMNPYLQVSRYGKVSKETIEDMIDKPWPIKAVIDEIDDLEIKIRLRVEARKRRLPVFMATELADSVMLDVERFDLEPERPLFHGLIPGIESLLDKTDMNHREWMKHAAGIIGPKNMPLNMQKSLLKIGSSIVTHPQLGSTVMMTGGVVTYAIKQTALDKEMPSQRTVISLEQKLVPQYRSLKHRRAHRAHTKVMHKALDSM